MCVSLYPAQLTGTRLMGHVVDLGGATRHVIGYQNTLRNMHPGANAMVLPIPAAAGEEIGPRNFLETDHAPSILKDMVDATTEQMRAPVSFGTFGFGPAAMQVFDHGAYSIAVGRNVTEEALADAFDRIPERRRPELNWDVLGAYPELYPDMPLAFACFHNGEAVESGPLLYQYRPADPDRLMLPALDAHDGRRPVLGQPVATDHDVLVGAAGGAQVHYTDRLGRLEPFLPTHVVRAPVYERLPNGDFTVDVRQLSDPERHVIELRRNGSDQPLQMDPAGGGFW